MAKLITIMIDGISADLFERHRKFMPNLDWLAEKGTQIEGVSPEMCGTSMPGRASIINGTPPSEHGIYGNKIFDETEGVFRWANPDDYRTPSLTHYATKQGLDVVNLGYGMVRPEDCSVYYGPWWVDEMIVRGRDQNPTPSDKSWINASGIVDPEGRLQALKDKGLFRDVIIPADEDPEYMLQRGMLADQQFFDIVAAFASSEKQPDLMIAEVGVTDYYMHKFGTDHLMTDLSFRVADAQVGALIKHMEKAGVLDDYNFLVLADHGHAAMQKGMYVDNLLDEDVEWSSEGGVLLVAPKDQAQADTVISKMTENGIELWNNDHYPEHLRDKLLTFVVPEGSDISFENAKNGNTDLFGTSKYKSNHGMRPGRWDDFRFCIFSGPDVAKKKLPVAETINIAPTMAKLLGVETPWDAQSLDIF
ncbi:alkaline phosphatase family protein [Curvivirga sp.]|uniref:alkaline phosphatase family protein n=1 Tax=Curvivirga sp. TaxID=2856848 RepID=UPI003B5C7EBC